MVWIFLFLFIVMAGIICIGVASSKKETRDTGSDWLPQPNSNQRNDLSSQKPVNNRYRISYKHQYDFDIVGENAYQHHLKKIAGAKQSRGKMHLCLAEVMAEPTNRHDPDAVVVKICNLTVGYFDRTTAKSFQKFLRDNAIPHSAVFEINGLVDGGWKDEHSEGNYGVKLAAPLDFDDWKFDIN